MLRPLPGIHRVILHATLLACAALAGYGVCRAAPTEVPAAAAPDVIATDREFAQTALESGIRAAYDRFLADDACGRAVGAQWLRRDAADVGESARG